MRKCPGSLGVEFHPQAVILLTFLLSFFCLLGVGCGQGRLSILYTRGQTVIPTLALQFEAPTQNMNVVEGGGAPPTRNPTVWGEGLASATQYWTEYSAPPCSAFCYSPHHTSPHFTSPHNALLHLTSPHFGLA